MNNMQEIGLKAAIKLIDEADNENQAYNFFWRAMGYAHALEVCEVVSELECTALETELKKHVQDSINRIKILTNSSWPK
jgi:hypothetical protein